MPQATRRRAPTPKPKQARKGIVAYLEHRHDPLTSLVLTIPVFVFYHLGILLIDLQNGVDLVSTLMHELLQQSIAAYVGVTLGVAAGLFGAAWYLRKKGKIRPARIGAVLIESGVLSIVMLLLWEGTSSTHRSPNRTC